MALPLSLCITNKFFPGLPYRPSQCTPYRSSSGYSALALLVHPLPVFLQVLRIDLSYVSITGLPQGIPYQPLLYTPYRFFPVSYLVIFLYDLEFKILKIDGLTEGVGAETDLCRSLEIPDVDIEPHRDRQIEFGAGRLERVRYFFRAVGGAIVLDDGIPLNPVAVDYFCPESHAVSSLRVIRIVSLCLPNGIGTA